MMRTDGGAGKRLEFPLRPGVRFPDWSAVTSAAAEAVVAGMVETLATEGRWLGCSATEDRVRCAVVDHYARAGHPPSRPELARSTGLSVEEIGGLLRNLAARDLVVLDGDDGAIAGAYPFCERETGHRVELGGRVLNAMCAIDALGAGAMCGTDASIASACRACGAEIRVTTRDGGMAIGACAPPAAVVWAAIHYARGCAATSLCTTIVFFCSDAHLESWRRADRPELRGYRLSVAEALEAGVAIFKPRLAAAAAQPAR